MIPQVLLVLRVFYVRAKHIRCILSTSRFVMVTVMFRAEFLEWENKILLSLKFCSKTSCVVFKETLREYNNRALVFVYYGGFQLDKEGTISMGTPTSAQ